MIRPTLKIALLLLMQLNVTLTSINNALPQDFDNEIHKLMTQNELNNIFGNYHEQIPMYEMAKVSLHHTEKRDLTDSQSPDYHLLAIVETANATIHLQLNRHNHVVSSSFEIELRHHNYTKVITADQMVLPDCLYQGDVKSGGKAAVSTCNEDGMVGLIISEESHFILHPIPKRLSDKMEPSHILYKKTDAYSCPHSFDSTMKAPEEPEENDETIESDKNGIDEDKNSSDEKSRTKRASSGTQVVETAVFVDDIMHDNLKKQFKDPLKLIKNIVFTMINAVQLLYNQPTLDRKFSFVLVKLTIMTSASEGPDKAKGDIKGYLLNFCKWQTNLNPRSDSDKKHWDNAIILSGLNLYQETPENHRVIGLAWVSGMCRPLYSCCINEGHNFETVFVITHELGHNLGMGHDGDKNKCSADSNIMSPSLGPGKIKWSSCSKKFLDDFLRKSSSSCMKDAGTIGSGLDHDAVNRLPGERFSIADQCVKAFGIKFIPALAKKKPFENVCRELWCHDKEGNARRAHPALDGTYCDKDKICKFGDCITDPRPPSQRPKSAAKGK